MAGRDHDETLRCNPQVRSRDGCAEDVGTVRRAKIQKKAPSQGEDASFRNHNSSDAYDTIRTNRTGNEEVYTLGARKASASDAMPPSVPAEPTTHCSQPVASVPSITDTVRGYPTKENALEASAGRTVSRWNRIGVNRGDGKTHGFRSLFR